MGGYGASEVAGEQDGAQHAGLGDGVDQRADQLEDAEGAEHGGGVTHHVDEGFDHFGWRLQLHDGAERKHEHDDAGKDTAGPGHPAFLGGGFICHLGLLWEWAKYLYAARPPGFKTGGAAG